MLNFIIDLIIDRIIFYKIMRLKFVSLGLLTWVKSDFLKFRMKTGLEFFTWMERKRILFGFANRDQKIIIQF